MPKQTYYGADLAHVHDVGYGHHADRCAPGVLALLEPVLRSNGSVLELGAGSGLLTRYLVRAGHDVVATDASEAMLAVLRSHRLDEGTPRRLRVARVVLPYGPLPPCDAVVSVGHVLNYLDTVDDLRLALVAAARALRPGGLLAVDLCSPDYVEAEQVDVAHTRAGDGWLLVQTRSRDGRHRFVRHITTFRRESSGLWRRADEDHANVLVDPAPLVDLLAAEGVAVRAGHAFGDEVLPAGLLTLVGTKEASGTTSTDRSTADVITGSA